MSENSIVRARIPLETKVRATEALKKMGLNPSDLIRMIFVRVAEEGKVPFSLEIPNRDTQEAIHELQNGGGVKAKNAKSLFQDLGI